MKQKIAELLGMLAIGLVFFSMAMWVLTGDSICIATFFSACAYCMGVVMGEG